MTFSFDSLSSLISGELLSSLLSSLLLIFTTLFITECGTFLLFTHSSTPSSQSSSLDLTTPLIPPRPSYALYTNQSQNNRDVHIFATTVTPVLSCVLLDFVLSYHKSRQRLPYSLAMQEQPSRTGGQDVLCMGLDISRVLVSCIYFSGKSLVQKCGFTEYIRSTTSRALVQRIVCMYSTKWCGRHTRPLASTCESSFCNSGVFWNSRVCSQMSPWSDPVPPPLIKIRKRIREEQISGLDFNTVCGKRRRGGNGEVAVFRE